MTKDLDTSSPFGSRAGGLLDRTVWAFADWRPFPAAMRRVLRKRFAARRAGPFDVTFADVNWRLYPTENQCDRIVFGRRTLPERAEHEALSAHLKPGMTFVDVGGNIGSYSLFVGSRAEDARLVIFEPHPRTRAKLLYNLGANDLPVDDVIGCALGDANGTLPLWSDGGSNIGHTSLLPEGTSNAAVSVDVPVRVLPDVLAARGVSRVDVLKIDVEGYEDRALMPLLEGDAGLWPKTVLIETAHRHLWERDVVMHMQGVGYSTAFQNAENLLLVR